MALGRSAGLGLVYLLLGAGGSKVASFLAQIALGFLLSEGDFGVYALAISIAMILKSMQDGGISLHMMSQTAEGFDEDAPPAFWLATASNVVVGVLLAASAWPIGVGVYGDVEVVNVLYLMAVASLLSAPKVMLIARLNLELRQDVIARMEVITAFAQHGTIVILAAAGWGPLSFAMGTIVAPIVKTIGYYMACPLPFKSYKPELSKWRMIFGKTKWLMLSSLVGGLLTRGDYLVAGLFVKTAVLGVYFFAWQFVAQIGTIVALNARTILIPIFTRMNDEPDRQRDALHRSIRAMMLFIPFATLMLGLMFPAVQKLIWEQRWEGAVIPVLILAIGQPLQTIVTVVSSALMARGLYRDYMFMLLGLGSAVVAATGCGAAFGGSAVWIAVGSTASTIVFGPWIMIWALREYGIPKRQMLAITLLPPFWAFVAAVGAVGVGWLVLPQVILLDPSVTGEVTKVDAAIEAAVLAMAYCVLFAGLVRTFCRSTVNEVLATMPTRVGGLGRRVLLLPSPEPSQA